MSVNDYDHELYELVQELIDDGALVEGEPAYGIALFTIDYGYDALSAKQKAVYDKHIAPLIGRLVEKQKINELMYSAAD